MKYKLFIFLFFISSCSPQFSSSSRKPYTAKGIAYIYNDFDFNEKVIKGRMNNEILQVSHQNLRTGALIKIINPENKKSIVLKNIKRIKFPDFYKILITKPVSQKLKLDKNLPLLEIIEIKKNKSFIAEKAKIYKEEKKISSKAPVADVQISNISKNKTKKIEENFDEIFIHIASFYSINTAKFLKQRIIKDVKEFNNNKIKIKKKNNKQNLVISGPYNSINLLKNDYILLKKFGFEELDIFINE